MESALVLHLKLFFFFFYFNLPDVSAHPRLSLFNSGAILAFMLGIFQIPLEECEQMYRKLGADVFKQNVIVGTVKMGWSHAFYDSEIWENILKLVHGTPFSCFFLFFCNPDFIGACFNHCCSDCRERMGEGHMIESARDPNSPKVRQKLPPSLFG